MNLKILPWVLVGLGLFGLTFVVDGAGRTILTVVAIVYWLGLCVVWGRMVMTRLRADR